MSSKCVFIFIFVLGACRTSALPVADVVRNIEDGVAKIGCDDASFTKAKPAVMKAISFFTQVNESKIACVDLSVQVGHVWRNSVLFKPLCGRLRVSTSTT